MKTFELNMDGLVGPTHHYAGLSAGNLASMQHAKTLANPAAAALQGIKKMRLLHQMGIPQGILPPHQRPNIELLRQLGFSGTPAQILKKTKKQAPDLLSVCFSASSMWTANAATVAPSIDTADHRVHFTPANLISHIHRHQEAPFTHLLLKKIFNDETHFHHHLPLPATDGTRDEGAANHNRLCPSLGESGVHLLIYNQQMLPSGNDLPRPKRFPARQTREASEAIARKHLLDQNRVFFAQQNPSVVDQGVFHNDVIAVANEYVFLLHEEAFLHQKKLLQSLPNYVQTIQIQSDEMSIEEAVQSYFFNSQLVTLPHQKNMALIAPIECAQSPSIQTLMNRLITSPDNPISEVHYIDLRQSMSNGGGPACLRLRVVLNDKELSAVHQGVLGSDDLFDVLEMWVKKHYRTTLSVEDLDDPRLIDESEIALDELTQILKLGSIYPFQKTK